ncbi:MAG: hypothetical protein QMD11_05860 [Smithella sp.]|nr:hypothetical protein [Smithella sp.]
MVFAGRKKEIKRIVQLLRSGKNVILQGKYGIGRTSLIKEISLLLSDENQFSFADFSQTPNTICNELTKQLGLPARLKNSGEKMRYKSLRHRIANCVCSPDRHIIVFDNIVKLTHQKIILLRHLIMGNRFQFIAIAENFISTDDLSQLRALLLPAEVLSLNYLKHDETISFLRLYSNQYNLKWSDDYMHGLALVLKGYPLSMIEMTRKFKGETDGRKSRMRIL